MSRAPAAIALLAAMCCLAGCGAAPRPDPTAVGLPVLGSPVLRHLLVLHRRGLALGVRDDVFAKIGDSNTANGDFLRALGCEHEHLGRRHDLLGTVRWFSRRVLPAGYLPFLFATRLECPDNSFVRIGFGAHPGWGVLQLLRPFTVVDGFLTFYHGRILIGRHPRPGARVIPVETRPAGRCPAMSALGCELQVIRPAVALVMIGTNDLRTLPPARFARALRRVVALIEGAGTIPVLSTIPPLLSPGSASLVTGLNTTVTRVAREDRLPLWDLWRALRQPGMINQGLRADGTHLSASPGGAADLRRPALRYGMNLRNLQALEILDLLRRRVLSEPRGLSAGG